MKKQAIDTEKAPKAIGPYSQAVKSNGLLFISGQIPFDAAKGELVCTNIKEEVHQVMKNVQFILEEANITFDNVIKSTIFLKDLNEFEEVNEIYASFFNKNNYPARECIEVSRLPKDVNVEISVIATTN